MKEFLVNRKIEKKSQVALLADLLGISYDAHDAIGDIKSLQMLIESTDIPKKKWLKITLSLLNSP